MPDPKRAPRARRDPHETPRPRPPRAVTPASDYPKPFISGLKGAATINKNARKQMESALKGQ